MVLVNISTHAIVYAYLITEGWDNGVHGFIVQLPSLDNHLPLSGIIIGDIGMKFGNGYITLWTMAFYGLIMFA